MGRILVALSAIALVLFFWNAASGYPRQAAHLPVLLGWVVMSLAILAIIQVAAGWRKQKLAGTLVLLPKQNWRELALGAGFLGLIIVYAWSIAYVGYLIATPAFLLIPLLALRPVGWIAILLTTVLVTGAIWGVFVYFLNLSIPLTPAI